jgi:hypothetical protein
MVDAAGRWVVDGFVFWMYERRVIYPLLQNDARSVKTRTFVKTV